MSHYFPPHYRVGARRPYYMARILSDLGHKVSVLTMLDPKDQLSSWNVSLDGLNVIRVPKTSTLRGAGFVKRSLFSAIRSTRSYPFLNKVFRGIGGPFLPIHFHLLLDINDERIKELAPDVIIASGGPWSIFESARQLKQRTGAKLYLDYRDPWNIMIPGLDLEFIHNWGKWPLSVLRKRHSRRCERSIGRSADAVISVSDNTLNNAMKASGCVNGHLILNGFGELSPTDQTVWDGKLKVTYTGRVYTEQTLDLFMKGLEILSEKNPDAFKRLEVRLTGVLDSSEDAIKAYTTSPIKDSLHACHFVDQEESLRLQANSDVLISLGIRNANGIPGSKFFEYLGTMRPIILITEKDDGKESILKETKAGVICRSAQDFCQKLEELISDVEAERPIAYHGDVDKIKQYSYAAQIDRLSSILTSGSNEKR